jgi:hypothetical protein
MQCTSWYLPGKRDSWSDFAGALRRVPPTILQGMLAAVVLCALAPATVHALDPVAWFTAPPRVAAPLPLIDLPDAPRVRCTTCGVVESIHPLAPVEGMPASYEFNVRLYDGSLRTSTSVGQGSWLVGDRIFLLGGDAAP